MLHILEAASEMLSKLFSSSSSSLSSSEKKGDGQKRKTKQVVVKCLMAKLVLTSSSEP